MYFGDYFVCDLQGGRAAGRSYGMTQHALFSLLHIDEPVRAFFMREVHSTIYSSLWADLKDRISEYEEFHDTELSGMINWTDNKSGENHAENIFNGNSITTKGFKASSGNQTANLKSLAGATHIYIEEADEIAKADYLKLKLSLRKKGANLKIIRSFNPPAKDHWIWEDYTLDKVDEALLYERIRTATDISDSELKAIVSRNSKSYYTASPRFDRHICINTNFTNNYRNLNEEAVKEYDRLLLEDFHYYVTNIIGFIASDGGDNVYYEYDKFKHHTDRLVNDSDVLHIGMDFNITKMSAVVHVIDSDVISAVAEHTNAFDTFQMCSILKDRYPNNKIVVYPDASGNSRSTTSGKSDFDTIRSFGFTIISGSKNPAVRDRINAVNKRFRTEKYKVNKNTCPEYSEALSKIKYKGGEPDKSSGLDHVTDGGGYCICGIDIPKGIQVKSGSAHSARVVR